MPVTNYQYDVTDTANNKVYVPQLTYEINNDAAIGVLVDDSKGINVNVNPGKIDICMADLLTAPQETALDAVVAAHQGWGINASMQGTLQLVNKEDSIISDVPWEVVDGVVTTPRFFDPDVTKIICRIIGEHKGDGGQLRLVEKVDGEADEEKIFPFFDFPDVGPTWTRFKVDSNVPPRDGLRNIYRTDCRLNGATNLTLRYATISMILVKVV
jgi:hypothetical protein